MLKGIWDRISNLGVVNVNTTNKVEVQRLRLTNQFIALALLFSGIFAVFCYAAHMHRAFYLEFFSVPVFLLLLLSNRAGLFELTKHLFVLSINVQVFLLCLFFGPASQLTLIYIPVAVIPLIIFGTRNALRIFLFLAFTLLLFAALFALGQFSALSEYPVSGISRYLEVGAVITAIVSEVFVIYLFISSTDQIEQRLDENNFALQSQIKAIFDHSQDALFLVEAESRKIIKANRRAVEIFEMDSEEDFYAIAGHNLHKHEMPAQQYEQMMRELSTRGIYEAEILYITKNGREFWGALSISMITILGANYQSVRVTDIHAQKLSLATTQSALHEKEVLLAEIHHRVKNNMAVISALLGLQSGYTEDEKAKRLFEESRNRIHTMALIHEKLYKHESLSKIEFGLYIHDLVAHIERSHNFIGTRIRFSVLCTDVFLDIKSAVPCGLILNELVTNACKHAFTGRSEGKIRIDCIKTDNKILLQVSDNGIGIQASDNAASSKGGLGMTLIEGLVDQLNGELSISHAGGTRYSVIFEQTTS